MIRYQGLILLLTVSANAFAEVPYIKVRLAAKMKKVLVSGVDIERSILLTNKKEQFSGYRKTIFNCEDKSNYVRRNKPMKLAVLSSKTGLLNWGKHRYKGKFYLQTSESYNGCDLINELSLEDYLSTLLPKEMSSSWPIEALKAQAVAARSYAYYKMRTKQVSRAKGFKTNYDLESSERHQVNGSYFDATGKTILATKKTEGEILTLLNGNLIPVFYHSKCGGKTLRPDQVWSEVLKGYASVECPYCHKHGKKNWRRKISKTSLVESLLSGRATTAKGRSDIKFIDGSRYQPSVRYYKGKKLNLIKKSRLRSTFGRKTLPSNYFDIQDKKDYIEIEGAGYGHGVGMCQFGAKEMALRGFTYKEILAHYFPELKLRKIY